jgi:hypothetical protein
MSTEEIKTLIVELLDGFALASLLTGWLLMGIVMLFNAWERRHDVSGKEGPFKSSPQL